MVLPLLATISFVVALHNLIASATVFATLHGAVISATVAYQREFNKPSKQRLSGAS